MSDSLVEVGTVCSPAQTLPPLESCFVSAKTKGLHLETFAVVGIVCPTVNICVLIGSATDIPLPWEWSHGF